MSSWPRAKIKPNSTLGLTTLSITSQNCIVDSTIHGGNKDTILFSNTVGTISCNDFIVACPIFTRSYTLRIVDKTIVLNACPLVLSYACLDLAAIDKFLERFLQLTEKLQILMLLFGSRNFILDLNFQINRFATDWLMIPIVSREKLLIFLVMQSFGMVVKGSRVLPGQLRIVDTVGDLIFRPPFSILQKVTLYP